MPKLLALMENQQSEHKALAVEHGLSLWVETDTISFLFDCGASPAVISNAHRLGIPLANAAFTVCSHSHYDHAAGFRDLVEKNLAAPLLYTGPHFWEKKYAFDGVCYTDLSCGFDESFLSSHQIEQQTVGDITEIADGVWLIGNFTRRHKFETIAERFVRGNPPHTIPDDFPDEICLALAGEKGITVVVGCSHPGILNMVETVHNRLNAPIYGVLGGTHLVEADENRIQKTIAEMKSMGVKLMGLSHCSGMPAEECVCGDSELKSCHLAAGCEIML
ncbi:MAG: MBL fold metallo-hydrolase [Candidatus Fimivivens sp.]|nr:MBL fold metallo-hydrolase [Candidatus Fimivivens sp.]